MTENSANHKLVELVEATSQTLDQWVPMELERGRSFAQDAMSGGCIFLGSGASHGSARFGAAKVIEAAGEWCWPQDVEEWSHLEYFCDPAEMPTMLLSASGRSHSREDEIWEAMHAVGRHCMRSQWQGQLDWSPLESELTAPLALWAAPSAYADERAKILSQEPFRGFRGGRDQREGGGASRIRSSERVRWKELGVQQRSNSQP
jgi:hypothetical protein